VSEIGYDIRQQPCTTHALMTMVIGRLVHQAGERDPLVGLDEKPSQGTVE